MKYLVTGACGLIGSAVARRLLSEGASVSTIDNLSTGNLENLPSGVDFIEGDCQDSQAVSQLNNESYDAILHIAGQSSAEISYDDPVYDVQTNTQSTLMLLDYAKKTGCMKFIYASSVSVYGDGQIQPVREDSPTVPNSFYAVGKLASENYLRIYSKYGISTTSLRLFNVFGPGQNMKNLRQGMVSIYLAQAIKNKKIIVKGSGDRFRDQVYIDDVVDAFTSAIDFNHEGYGCFNIGTGRATTVNQVIDAIKRRLGENIDVEFSSGTLGDVQGIYSDSNLAYESMSWKSKISFEDGINRMVDWAIK